jgi:sulfate adenylyltransferase
MTSHLIAPYGGALVELLAAEERLDELRAASKDWRSWDLTQRQLCDLELLLCGAFSPLAGFQTREDYDGVCREMRLADGTLWPVPVTLDVSEAVAEELQEGEHLALRDPEGVMLAVLHVEQLWRPDREAECRHVYGTDDVGHPGVLQILRRTHPVYVGGRVEGVQLPVHYDFRLLRHTPRELRGEFARRGWRRIMAFQTRTPMHRAHHAATVHAVREHQANLLIHPAVGLTKPGDVDHFTRVRCYQAIQERYPRHTAMLSLLPLSMRLAGPREALLHGIIRRNYGCTHMIVGRDQAGPGASGAGEAFYEPYAALHLFAQHHEELGIDAVPVKEMVYVHEHADYYFFDRVPEGCTSTRISGAVLHERLATGKPVPDWFSFPEVIRELRRTYPPRHRQGFTVFFTGLSGAGKSTIANVLLVRLLEMGGRPVTLLDGDIVRKNLSSELTFSKEHRDINIRRIGFVASEITKNGGIAICAPIAPYDQVRKDVREVVSPGGGFILVHVATPLDVCEGRDRKGMYAKARAGLVKEFTGISDPYEEPRDAEVAVDTTDLTPDMCAQQVLLYLEREGYITGAANGDEASAP